MSKDQQDREPTLPKRGVRRWWAIWRRPSARFSLGGLLVIGVAVGIVLWGGFHTVVEATNTETFCVSCHEMGDNVYPEYKMTGHYANRTGVRATCSDCHVPDSWGAKIMRKIVASRELWHTAMGSIDTPEKFEAKRLELAQRVWDTMERTDSRECRNCHDFGYMDYMDQSDRALRRHQQAEAQGETCIDCHKGIAHRLPDMTGLDPSQAPGGLEADG
ncbi:Denitrification system component NirT [Billgrantia azerbaijanica]|nr:Denitrification system component NirT [Halomonas azerbaijanica]